MSTILKNKFQKKHDVICFEMKNVGVIHKHLLLMIREICDYSDFHKNKK